MCVMSNKVYDVIIIGAGASGLAAAIQCSRRKLSCLILDKNKKPGNKLYAAGNGRCNVTNRMYQSDVYYNNPFTDRIMAQTDIQEFTAQFFDEIGIRLINKNGYYYPMSMQASSVVWALLDAIDPHYVDRKQNTEVTDIEQHFDADSHLTYKILCQDHSEYLCHSLILCIGGCSAPNLGAADSTITYGLLDKLTIRYRPFKPALAPIYVKEDIKNLTGVRQSAVLTVGRDNVTESGEVQFTENGISGIVVFNLAEYIREAMDTSCPYVYINPIPEITEEDYLARYQHLRSQVPSKTILAFLNGFMNDKLAAYLVEQYGMYAQSEYTQTAAAINKKSRLEQITPQQASNIYHYITHKFRLQAAAVSGFDKSQASSGGIITDQICPDTMEIRERPGIYVAGEAIDVLGKCGGYNISFALYTGWVAGNHAGS